MTRDLFHILTPAAWDAARAAGTYAPPSLESEGFIHLSTAAQVVATANRFYGAAPELMVLVVPEPEDALRWEEGEPGELFPHLYRALPVAEVREVRRLGREGGVWARVG